MTIFCEGIKEEILKHEDTELTFFSFENTYLNYFCFLALKVKGRCFGDVCKKRKNYI